MNNAFLPIQQEDLDVFTNIIHKLNPMLNKWRVLGIEVPKKGDQNFIFHVYNVNDQIDVEIKKIMMSYLLFVSEETKTTIDEHTD